MGGCWVFVCVYIQPTKQRKGLALTTTVSLQIFNLCVSTISCVCIMEAIKKKLAALKEEKEAAIERAEEAEQQRKESEAKFEQVSCPYYTWGK